MQGDVPMTDDELLEAFEASTLPAEQFPHAAHVRVAWCYASRHCLPEALARFSGGLRRFATATGAPGRYHETITVAYMLLIAERLDDARDESWERFSGRNPDLLAWRPSILSRYYRDETLQSARARRVFVMPDRPSPLQSCNRQLKW